MQFFQILTGVAAIAGCSANLIHLNDAKLHHGNKIFGLQQFDSGNKLIGLQHLDAENKLIGLQHLDAGNKLIGMNAFDHGNKMIGLQSFGAPSKLIMTSHPANMHLSTARGFGMNNAGLSSFALGGVSPIVVENSGMLLNSNANARAIQLMDASPAISTFGARSLNLGHVSAAPGLVMAGRSADQIIATQGASADVKPVTAAVATVSRTVDYAPVAYSGEAPKTQVVNVPPNEQGLHINFVSKSSPLTVSQQHIGGESGQVQVTESVDEPQRLVHNVKKSVIQEVNEVVQPFRVLKQEVKPVIEQAHTLVAEGNNIPLSGRSSGVIATETAVPSALVHRPTQVITAHEPRAMNIATIAQPMAADIAVAAPAALNLATVAQPRAMNIAVAQPRAFGVSTIAQPAIAGFGMQKLAFSRPMASHGSLLLADSNPAMITEKRHMLIHQEPSMMIHQRNFAMPMASSAMNTRFFTKPAAFTTGNIKIQRF